MVPAIADYEVRRELVRLGRTSGVQRLDQTGQALGVVPVDADVWRQACVYWAMVRNQGRPTAPPDALDGDAILAATATVLGATTGEPVIIATENLGHFQRFGVAADLWSKIAPPTV
jgi:predicted nucleic acid-binding protein